MSEIVLKDSTNTEEEEDLTTEQITELVFDS
jgi:hypothetical protein